MKCCWISVFLAGIHLFKAKIENTKTIFEIYAKLVIKTSKQRHSDRSGLFSVNLEHISHIVLVFPLLTLYR